MDKTIVYTNEYSVSCDGDTGEGPDHPLVYYTLKEYKDGQTKAACHYCGKLYLYKYNLDKNSITNIQSLETNDLI
jgi:uncharacterized Zn-finger protein